MWLFFVLLMTMFAAAPLQAMEVPIPEPVVRCGNTTHQPVVAQTYTVSRRKICGDDRYTVLVPQAAEPLIVTDDPALLDTPVGKWVYWTADGWVVEYD